MFVPCLDTKLGRERLGQGGRETRERRSSGGRGDERRREPRGNITERLLGRERKETGRRREERNEARHISLACADSSSFVTVAAINNSAILSLWIIRVGLCARAVVAPVGVVFRSIQFGLRGRYNGLEEHAFQGMCHSSLGDMACDLVVHLGTCSLFSPVSNIFFMYLWD